MMSLGASGIAYWHVITEGMGLRSGPPALVLISNGLEIFVSETR
jgi:hypothetical protein